MLKKDIRRNQQYAYCERLTYRWSRYNPEQFGEAQCVTVTSLSSELHGGIKIQLPDGEIRDVFSTTLLDRWDNHLSWMEQHRAAQQTRDNLEALITEVKSVVGEGEEYWDFQVNTHGPHNEPQRIFLSYRHFVQLADLALRAARDQDQQAQVTGGLAALLG